MINVPIPPPTHTHTAIYFPVPPQTMNGQMFVKHKLSYIWDFWVSSTFLYVLVPLLEW